MKSSSVLFIIRGQFDSQLAGRQLCNHSVLSILNKAGLLTIESVYSLMLVIYQALLKFSM